MNSLQILLDNYRAASRTEREKGTYFENLTRCYLQNEASYRDLYESVWSYAEWARLEKIDARDTGIDLVAQTQGTGEYHAIQCKFYAENYPLQKKDIDSFFTASGKEPFTHRIIVSTTRNWSHHAEEALHNQHPPVTLITLTDLENSQIDWHQYQLAPVPVLKAKKQLRPHQRTAIDNVIAGLQTADRGKLIMACGTGKTFTSLKIAESIAGLNKRVLFLVPSLALLSQTLTEWTQESSYPLHCFAVCSDSDVGNKKKNDDDAAQTFIHELRYPATTNAEALAREIGKRHDVQHISVIFSTYHSLAVISQAQKHFALADFDLMICDEAHRTTGATFAGEEESSFVKVHDNNFVRAAKRIYMTATPRIYGNLAKAKADQDNVTLCSMDDELLYGKELHVINFSEAVKRQLLVDYKVIVLAVEEAHVNRRLQDLLKDDNNQINVNDASKIVGCWKALAKQGLTQDLIDDSAIMKRAVAFCQVIEISTRSKVHKISSKQIAAMFQKVVEEYQKTEQIENQAQLICEAQHVDGSMNASEKEIHIDWLKAESPENTCRILSNVRCLSEGIDVPALDAVLFLTPRNSQIDVVQSVGRVMRNAPGKKRGYVILPVVIPAGIEPHEALNDNKTYAVVWQVLQALRAHDDRFDAMINKLDLIGKDPSKMEIIAVTDKIVRSPKSSTTGKNQRQPGRNSFQIGAPETNPVKNKTQYDLQFEIGEIERAIYAKLVQKVGNRHHWEDWAQNIGAIAHTHIQQIKTILADFNNSAAIAAFNSFAQKLRVDLSVRVTDEEIIEMLAQHLITKPVFAALFNNYDFATHNPISRAMRWVLDALAKHGLDQALASLQGFYADVKMRAEGIDNAAGKQRIIIELYDKFFRLAFPRISERLGIVYTPVEVVDFIIHSVNHLLTTEFNTTLGSNGVHILDPFTGTGTFMTRLLQSGLITPAQLAYKYQNELHANEIVLLAYYIAAINIESVYHELIKTTVIPPENGGIQPQGRECKGESPSLKMDAASPWRHDRIIENATVIPPGNGGIQPQGRECKGESPSLKMDAASPWRHDRIMEMDAASPWRHDGIAEAINYQPFPGVCLTDTFALLERKDLISELLDDNTTRIQQQKQLDIRVIIGNPPYSAGQNSANDNNQNLDYPHLDERIAKTYAARSTAKLAKGLYDSYIRAIRWASDRIQDCGIIGFVTNAGFIDSNSADGLRQCLAEEFSSIYIFHLRGNGRTSGERCRKEGHPIFAAHGGKGGSLAPISITFLIKNPNNIKSGEIYFHDIGDYLKRQEKLEKISAFGSIAGITDWQFITPDQHGDWLKQRNNDFADFIVLGNKDDKKGQSLKLFDNFSLGVATNRDAWCYNASQKTVAANMQRMIAFYNSEVKRFAQNFAQADKKTKEEKVDDFVNTDSTKISWTRALKQELVKNRPITFVNTSCIQSLYRPFTKQWLYFNRQLNEMVLQMPRIFPNAAAENRVICVNGKGSRNGITAIIANVPVDLNALEAGAQCFPLYLYDETLIEVSDDLFGGGEKTKLVRKDAITDAGLLHFQVAYGGTRVIPPGNGGIQTHGCKCECKSPSMEMDAASPWRHDGIIGKEDVFYYVYGVLHCRDYREKYADNLGKELPRIPRAANAKLFWELSRAGRELAELHINYERVPMYAAKIEGEQDKNYRVEKMRYGKIGKEKDLTTIIYNEAITISEIPLEAYEYVVNGKPALDWVIERQGVRIDKDSGIVNDANDWAVETMGNPRYPLELLLRVITVSLETMRIVKSLPRGW